MRYGLRIFILILAAATASYAQGGGGRSDSAVVRSPKTASPTVRAASTAAKSQRRMPASLPIIRKPQPACLAITINEGGSTVGLDRIGAEAPNELISVSSRSSALIQRTLPAGTYTIAARKPGFHDVVRTIDLAEGKRRRFNIVLRPKMAILSVASNVADARIAIDRLGVFDRPIKKQFVVPGVYNVTVSRRGYETRTIPVNLKRAGQEENLNVVLQPLRIDAVLALADQHIARGRFEEAGALIDDVLLLNDSHARANLLRGMVELKKGSAKAVGYFVNAIKLGATLQMKMELTETGMASSAAVTVSLDLASLEIQSEESIGLNYKIKRNFVSALDWSGQPAFIAVKGRSDFHGRHIEPNLRLSASESSPMQLSATEMEIIFKLLTAWRNLPETRAAR